MSTRHRTAPARRLTISSGLITPNWISRICFTGADEYAKVTVIVLAESPAIVSLLISFSYAGSLTPVIHPRRTRPPSLQSWTER